MRTNPAESSVLNFSESLESHHKVPVPVPSRTIHVGNPGAVRCVRYGSLSEYVFAVEVIDTKSKKDLCPAKIAFLY